MSLPPFPPCMFPNEVIVFLCDDVVGRRGGANPARGAGVAFFASVQDKGTYWAPDRNASVARYKVSFNVNPSLYLSRPIGSGDEIDFGGLTLTSVGPLANRGGYDFLWRVDCEHVKQ